MSGMMWAPNTAGGYLANPRLSRTIRHAAQPLYKFRQFSRAEPGYGKGKGDTLLFDRVSNVQTSGGAISEQNRIPETTITVSRGQVVVNEYGNSIPWTGKLETLSEFSIDNLVTVALRNDMADVLDQAVHDVFATTPVKMIPTGTVSNPSTTVDTDGTASTAATRDILPWDIKEAADYLEDTLHAEKYDGENYIAIGRTAGIRKLFDSAEWTEAAKYGDPERLFAGEVGRYYHVRVIKETGSSLKTLSAASLFASEMFVFGADPIVEGMALPEEIRSKIPEDYGRSKGLAWYGIMGWALPYDTANDGEARVVHITSA